MTHMLWKFEQLCLDIINPQPKNHHNFVWKAISMHVGFQGLYIGNEIMTYIGINSVWVKSQDIFIKSCRVS